MSPTRLFRLVARAEAVTWALLLIGMFLKYGTRTTEVGVTVAGPIHGAVFLAFCVVTTFVAVDQRWSFKQWLGGVLTSVPPFLTVWFESYAEKRDLVTDTWRLGAEPANSPLEKAAAFVIRKPWQGAAVGAVLVAALFSAALVAGPPV